MQRQKWFDFRSFICCSRLIDVLCVISAVVVLCHPSLEKFAF